MRQCLLVEKGGERIGKCTKEMVVTDSRNRSSNMISQVVLSIHVHLFFKRVGKIHGMLRVHVDDVFGGGDETFDRIMTTVRKEFDFGAWNVGNFRVQGSPDFADAKCRDRVRHGAIQA